MNVILGSGITGLIAKAILGNDWIIIPFRKSRFFTFNPPLCDNFIIRDDRVDDVIKDLVGDVRIFPYVRAWSYNGDIIRGYDEALAISWLDRLFGNDYPSQSPLYLSTRMNLYVYDIRINKLYEKLLDIYMDHILENTKFGLPNRIVGNVIEFDSHNIEFDRCVSTIPLPKLYELMGVNRELVGKDVTFIHVATDDLDFEGCNQLFVVDDFSFYKVSNIAPGRYLFYFNDEIADVGLYLMNFIGKFDILDGTVVKDYLICGEIPPSVSDSIYCVGSYAQWDWCADLSSNIYKLLKFSNGIS